MSCYIHGDGTFDLKIHAFVWGGGNMYNLEEMERAISVELPKNTYGGTEIPVFRRCVAGMTERTVWIISIIKK